MPLNKLIHHKTWRGGYVETPKNCRWSQIWKMWSCAWTCHF